MSRAVPGGARSGTGAVLAAVLLAAVLLIWLIVRTGQVAELDAAILRGLRRPGQPDVPVGPRWLARALLDVTVLGGGRMLTLLVAGAAGLFVVRRQWPAALLLMVAAVSGSRMVSLLKDLAGRARPDVVRHLVDETTRSFPSAHAANSATVYLMLALLVMRREPDAATRRYVLGGAIAMTALIGGSRVYLGVHWPSDVLAGWCFGVGWATMWYTAALRLLPRRPNG